MDEEYLRMAIETAQEHSASGENGPFGAVIVSDGKVVGVGWNRVVESCDATAHAEIVTIRAASARLKTNVLAGCTIYTSCEPCPMCLAAIYWARIERVVFAAAKEDASAAGFDDGFIYREMAMDWAGRKVASTQLLRSEAQAVFRAWVANPKKKRY